MLNLKLKKYERGYYPIAIISTLDKSFIVDGINWIPISENLNLDDAKKYYETVVKKKEEIKTIPAKQWEVKSSDGEKTYTVRFWNDYWTCDCLGYQYRKTCRHIDECKQLI